MPVLGLSDVLENLLTTLNQSSGLSSWKISSQDESAATALRFADPLYQADALATRVRRACPSQLWRDEVRREVSYLVGWCFKPNQPKRIISELRETFIKRHILERTKKAEIRPEERSEKAENCRENLWNWNTVVPAASSSSGGNVAVYVFDVNHLSLPTPPYSVLVSVSVFMALSGGRLSWLVKLPTRATYHQALLHRLNVLPLQPGVGQCIAIHAMLTARDFFLAYFYPSRPFTCIFSKTSPNFSCVGCG